MGRIDEIETNGSGPKHKVSAMPLSAEELEFAAEEKRIAQHVMLRKQQPTEHALKVAAGVIPNHCRVENPDIWIGDMDDED